MLAKVLASACMALWTVQAGPGSEDWRELMIQGRALHLAGKYLDAIQAFRKAETLTGLPGADLRRAAVISESLGAAYADSGQITNAGHEYRRALAALENCEGSHSIDYAVVLATIADLHDGSGVGEDIISKLRHALTEHEKSGPAEKLAVIRICLAQIFSKERRYGEAEALLLDTQAALNKQSAPEPKTKAGVLNALVVLRFDQGRYRESVQADAEYLRYLETVVGTQHPSLVVGWSNMATNYVKLGRFEDAVKAYETSLSIAGKVLNETNPTYGPLLENYAFALRKVGRKAEAKGYARKSRQIRHTLDQLNASRLTVSISALRDGRD
jgi:tetratricopeptide (TPR) repeat protein